MITTRSFLICTLVALSLAHTGLFGGRGSWRNRPIFSPSSSFSYHEHSGGLCLNGGTSVPALTTGQHLFCLCADGFDGRNCEIVKHDHCYEGIGFLYRGTASKTVSGKTCEMWDSDTREQHLSSDIYSGRHNYCRNILYKRRPWCYVLKNQQLEWEYCNIPRCGFKAIPGVSPPATTQPLLPEEMTCGQRRQRKLMKIVGGTDVTVESHPWIAAIFFRTKSQEKAFRCGGSLISPCWVLTAAHCFPRGSHTKPWRFSIMLGKNVLNESDPIVEQSFRVEEIYIHEEFDNSEGNFNNDIALMKLKARRGRCAVETSSVKTICLPPPLQSLQPGATCEIVGYGKENYAHWYRSQYLREAQVNVLPDHVCRHKDYYGDMITDNMFCAARPDWSQDACEGDSGGPLVCQVDDRLFQFGIISWGDGCAKDFRPGVYAKLTNYNKWIEEKTGLSSITAGALFPQK
ncbi:plasminogen activator, urokinase b [Pholidichthys leucotaenia]